MANPDLTLTDDLSQSIENLNHNDASHPTPPNSTIIQMALSPEGSQTLQLFLSYNEPRVTNIIFRAVLPSIFDIMTNQFGHHVFGTLIPLCSDLQLYKLASKLAMHPELLVLVCINRFGSPSIKRFIKEIAMFDSTASILVEALYMAFKNLMIDKTGSHVILQCLESFKINHNYLLYKAALNNILFVGTNVNGCSALKRFIAASVEPGRNILLEKVSDFSVCLAQDPYGTFVVQFLLELQHPEITEKISYLLKGHYVKMSSLKKSSHVVEKCLMSSARVYAVLDFIQCPNKVFLQVVKDQYGNYVIQTALRETMVNPEDLILHQRLVAKIRMQLQYLQRGPGKNVANLIAQLDSKQKHVYGGRN